MSTNAEHHSNYHALLWSRSLAIEHRVWNSPPDPTDSTESPILGSSPSAPSLNVWKTYSLGSASAQYVVVECASFVTK